MSILISNPDHYKGNLGDAKVRIREACKMRLRAFLRKQFEDAITDFRMQAVIDITKEYHFHDLAEEMETDRSFIELKSVEAA